MKAILPVMASVVAVYLATGMALPTLPLHLHDGLHQSTFVIGAIAGLQFAAALLSRVWAGTFSDRNGPKSTVLIGLGLTALGGALYLLSLAFLGIPSVSIGILALARVFLGGGECFAIIGGQTWALALYGSGNTGKAIAHMGTALYLALAIGAPFGSLLYETFGFASLGLATLILPCLALLMVLPLSAVRIPQRAGGSVWGVVSAVLLPGLGLSFASLGYGAMTTFSVLYFTERGWQPAWLSFTIFAVAFILARLLLGGLGDRMGGARVSQIFATVQVIGLGLMALAPSALVGFLGAAVTGFGYSLVYPALGLEAVKRAPMESRGLAIGTYTAFLDLTLGFLSPLLGLLASWSDLGSVFLASSAITAGAVWISVRLKTP